MNDFTPVQHQFLQFWRNYSDQNGYSPTIREACKFFGLSGKNGVHECCTRCVAKGGMARAPGNAQSRGFLLTKLGRELTEEDAPRPIRLAGPDGTIVIGWVVQPWKCKCGQPHFRSAARCAQCAPAPMVVT